MGDTVIEMLGYYQLMMRAIDAQLSYGPVKKLIHDRQEKFDLVIVEYFFVSPLAFAKRFGCPSIGMLSLDALNFMYQAVGNPTNPVLYPDSIGPFGECWSMAEKFANIFHHLALGNMFQNVQEKEKRIVTKHFGNDYHSVNDLYRNVSLLFENSDPVFHQVRPLVPAVIQIGGGSYRISAKPLSNELKATLDRASAGFIYFSLGSNMATKALPSPLIELLWSTFADLPFVVLWKSDIGSLQNQFANVIISKWFPQQALMTSMLVLLNVFAIVSVANAARILGIVPTPFFSHQVVFQPLWRELSLRGHHVTTITTHPINDPKLHNLTEIDLSKFHDDSHMRKLFKEWRTTNIVSRTRDFYRGMVDTIDQMLAHSLVTAIIADPNAKYDLVIAEYLFTSVLAFAERFDCPSIGMFTQDAWNAMHRMVGNPTHATLYPDSLLPFDGSQLSLSERVVSFIFYHINAYLVDHVQDMQQELVTKHFGSSSSVQDLSQNISLLFINSDPIFHYVRPMVPAVIQVGGGFGKLPSKPLPKDLKRALDSATNGFIYFSLGSLKNAFLTPKEVEVFLSTFVDLPYTVLWKLDDETTAEKPSNVIFSKWFPQQDILSHPNIKLFITQGGLQSMDEAIYQHVPMIGIPFFGDQSFNVKKMVRKGFGLELDYRTLKKDELKGAILEAINNPKYRTTLKNLAELAQDQPMTGLEKAVWWSEYVIRHKGAKHLRSPLLDIPWYQYLLLDVIGVIGGTIALIVYLVYFILKSVVKLVRYLCRPKRKTKSKSKVKKN